MVARAWLALSLACVALSCREKRPAPDRVQQRLAPAATSGPSELPPAPPDVWVESSRYRMRVVDMSPCGEERTEAAAYRLAIRVEVEAKPGADVAPVFASPAGFTLVKDGKIFRPAREATPGCGALLEPKNLAPGERTRGILVFRVPHVSYLRSSVLRFKPPRWGFESTVSVELPACFGAECREAPVAERTTP